MPLVAAADAIQVELRSHRPFTLFAPRCLQVISLQAELNVEVQRREAAEVQLERHLQRHSRPGLTYTPAVSASGSQTPQRLATQGLGTAASTPHSRSLGGSDPAMPPTLQPRAGDSQSRLPFLGRLQTDAATANRCGCLVLKTAKFCRKFALAEGQSAPQAVTSAQRTICACCRPATRTPRPFLQDVKQWLQSKQQEVAPWASPLSSGCLPRPPQTAHSQGAGQLPHANIEQQAASVTPGPRAHQQASPMGAARRSMYFKPQDSGASGTSGSDPDSPDNQQFGRRRVTRQQQPPPPQQAQQQGGWTFKPAWNDGGEAGSSPCGPHRSSTVSRESSAGTGNRVDEVSEHQLEWGMPCYERAAQGCNSEHFYESHQRN